MDRMQIDHTKPCKSCGAEIYAILEIIVYKLRARERCRAPVPSSSPVCSVCSAVWAQNAWLCIYGIIKQIK